MTSAFMLEKAERRIAELEAERDGLRAELDALKTWRTLVREAVDDPGFCCCDECEER